MVARTGILLLNAWVNPVPTATKVNFMHSDSLQSFYTVTYKITG
jgi:hypothetical protein